MENTVNPTETTQCGDVDSGEKQENGSVNEENNAEIAGEEPVYEDGDEYGEEEDLLELRRISGIEYDSLTEFTGYERYLELKNSGVLTAEEAFYAVNRGKKRGNTEYDGAYSANVSFASGGSKRHMTATRRKPSSGEVFTRADREELAKWGISATGSELERLWREAGGK